MDVFKSFQEPLQIMKCSLLIAFSFIFCSVAYGASSAAVTQALKQFTPELIIVFRMVFGCSFCFIVMIFRMIFQKGYATNVRAHFCSGFWPLFHLWKYHKYLPLKNFILKNVLFIMLFIYFFKKIIKFIEKILRYLHFIFVF